MKWFLNITTRSKLFICFSIILILLVTSLIMAYTSIMNSQEAQKLILGKNFETILALSDLRTLLNRERTLMLEMMITPTRTQQENIQNEIKSVSAEINQELQRIQMLEFGPQFPRQIDRIIQAQQNFQVIREDIQAQIYEGKRAEAQRLYFEAGERQVNSARSLVLNLVHNILAQTKRQNLQDIQKSENLGHRTIRNFLILSVAAFVLAFLLTLYLGNIISIPLKNLSQLSDKMAQGDLTAEIGQEQRKDEVGRLAQSFRKMIENFREANREILEGTNVLGTAVSEILATSIQLTSSSAETAAAVSQTTSTVEEVKQTSRLSNQKAIHVSESSKNTAQISLLGKKAVEESNVGLDRIKEQMDKVSENVVQLSEQNRAIGEIMATVNDLAEQSNLLSVNAAIEAAKAGEQGKGFTVVAQEIRGLAEQSKQATVQVRMILSEIQKVTNAAVLATEQCSKTVEIGMRQSEAVNNAINTLTESINESASAATQIAASGQQQMVGMDQVALAMENIKTASAQNLSNAKQIELSAQNLEQLGKKLKELVNKFKT